jgi:excisionase family DNA binding protein
MPLNPFSLTSDLVSPASGECAGSGARKRTDIPKFYTIAQIAECTKSHERTVRRWIEKRWLVVHRINGLVRIAEADFLAFLAAHRANC